MQHCETQEPVHTRHCAPSSRARASDCISNERLLHRMYPSNFGGQLTPIFVLSLAVPSHCIPGHFTKETCTYYLHTWFFNDISSIVELLEKLKVFRNGTSWRTELNRENFLIKIGKGRGIMFYEKNIMLAMMKYFRINYHIFDRKWKRGLN